MRWPQERQMSSLSRLRPPFVLIAVVAVGCVLVYLGSVILPPILRISAPFTRTPGAIFAAGVAGGGRESGQSNYQSQCAACHGSSGKGDGWRAWLFRLKMRDFTDSAYMQTLSDEYLFQIIKQGGASLGKPGMPSWGQELTDREIQVLVVYIRSLAMPPGQPQLSGPAR